MNEAFDLQMTGKYADETSRNRCSQPENPIIFAAFGPQKFFQNLLLTDHE